MRYDPVNMRNDDDNRLTCLFISIDHTYPKKFTIEEHPSREKKSRTYFQQKICRYQRTVDVHFCRHILSVFLVRLFRHMSTRWIDPSNKSVSCLQKEIFIENIVSLNEMKIKT